MIKVSVILPVFNAGIYLAKCIGSVLAQTEKNIELIIVDDGSTDDSLLVIEQFKRENNRVKVISQENKGVSAARNKGLEIAGGEWIAFVDADDWLEPDMFQKMYDAALLENADMIICNVNSVSNRGLSERLKITNETIDFQNARQDTVVNLMRFKYDYANWNKIYSAKLVKNNNLSFSDNLSMYEDLLFNLHYWQYCKKSVVINECLYNYRIHNASVMNQAQLSSTIEFNKLSIEFIPVCNQNGWLDTLKSFEKEMRRGFYYHHLPLIISNVQQQKISKLQKIRLLASELKKLSPIFYKYNKEELRETPAIKKVLLKYKIFYLFSIIEMLRRK